MITIIPGFKCCCRYVAFALFFIVFGLAVIAAVNNLITMLLLDHNGHGPGHDGDDEDEDEDDDEEDEDEEAPNPNHDHRLC